MTRGPGGGRRVKGVAWASVATAIAALGAYASLVAQVDEPLTGPRLGWTVVAVVGTAVFTFLSIALGSTVLGARTGPAEPAVAAPGSDGPPIDNLTPRNPCFVGRTALLDGLARRMAAATGGRAEVLYGLGGVGKTQLVLEYAHRFRERYGIVWWVPAERAAGIIDALLGLARALGVTETADQGDLLAALWARLRESSRWLLIFDNAEDVRVLRAYWPPANGHVLVTSRGGGWRELVAAGTMVRVLDREDAVEFLCRRASSADRAAAGDLADELGHLPLALAQAAAYVDRTRTTIAGYRELLLDRWQEVSGIGKPADYGETVATTWAMSVGKAEEHAPGARDLLALLSFLAPDDIPRGLLRKHAGRLAGRLAEVIADRVTYDMTIMELVGYGLISAETDRIDVHRLVQRTLREGMTEADAAVFAERAVRLLDGAFPANVTSPATWPLCARLLPHVLTACEHTERYGVATAIAGRLLHQAAHYLHWRVDYDQARLLYGQALALREATFGPDHPEVAETLSGLARLCFHRAELPDARRFVERSLAIRGAVLDPHDALITEDLAHLGRVLREQSDLARARQVTERALALREAAHGEDDPRCGQYADLLGVVLWRMGELGDAHRLHERALRVLRAAPGAAAPQVGTCLKHLGIVCRDLGWLLEAERHLEEGAAIMGRAFGEEHLETITVLVRLWDVRRRLGDPAGAREHLTDLVRRRAARLGEHPDVALCLVGLGAALRDQEEPAEARDVLLRASRIYVATYGPRHPYAAEALLGLGPVLHMLGETTRARDSLWEALDIFERAYGPWHPAVAETLECLVPVVRNEGRHDLAEEYERRLLAIRARAAGLSRHGE